MPSPLVQFRAVAGLDVALDSRADGDPPAARALAETARRDLTRYYALLDGELGRAAGQLSPGGALLIVDALRGTLVDDQLLTARHLDHEIEDSLADGLAEKWSVDGTELLEVVRGWTLAARLAVIDAVERFHRLGGDITSYEAALRTVGLQPVVVASPPDMAAYAADLERRGDAVRASRTEEDGGHGAA